MKNPYSNKFYDNFTDISFRSASIIVPHLLDLYNPNDWWRDKTRVNTLNKYRNLFANCSQSAEELWADTISKMMKESIAI